MLPKTKKNIISFAFLTFGILNLENILVARLSAQTLPAKSSNPSPYNDNGKPITLEEFNKIVKQKVPGYYTIDDLSPRLKSLAVVKNGQTIISIPKGETTVLPNGDKYLPDGSLVKKNGVKFQPVVKNGKFQGNKVFKPNGVEMKPGETYKTTDGVIIRLK
jgi:hypothetical protein